jgi:hypothetical protein
MILDPVNSITSVQFYKKVAKRSIPAAFGYLAYLALLFSVASVFAVRARLMPSLLETFAWMEQNVPTITYAKGEVAVAGPQPLTLRHPKAPELGLIIDTGRVEPVTPKTLDDAKALAFLTKTALYIMERPGAINVYDFSKMATGSEPVVIDAKFYRSAGEILPSLLYPAAFLIAFLGFMAWKTVSTVFYSLVALMINGMFEGPLLFAPLALISLHAQTLVVVLQAMALFLPGRIPGFQVLAWVITGVYICLAVKANIEPAPSSQDSSDS